MNGAKFELRCKGCGTLFSVHDRNWFDRGEYFVHYCDKHTVSYSYLSDIVRKKDSVLDKIKAAIAGVLK